MKVIRNYLYNAGYQLLVMIAPLITTPYISRVLGAQLSGVNAYTNSWVTFFYLLGQMGITVYGNRQIAYCRDDPEKRTKTFWEIEALQTITASVALIAYLVAVFAFSTTLQTYFLEQSFWIIAVAFDVSWYFMGLEDFKKTVVRNTIVKLVTIVTIFALVKSHQDLGKYILLLGLAQLIGNLTLWPYLKGSLVHFNLKGFNPFRHFYPALLLFIPAITTQVYVVVNRLMLGRMTTPSALGQFDYGDKIVKMVLAIVTATGTVMLPNVANKFAKHDIGGVRESLYSSFEFVTAIAIPICFGLMAISVKFAPWFLGGEYAPTGTLIMIESPAIIFIAWSTVLGTQYLTPINRIPEVTLSVTIGAISNVIFNAFFIHRWGANGAALATDLSELLVTLVQLYCVRTTIRRRDLFINTWRYLVSAFIMFLVVNRISTMIKMSIQNLIVEVLTGIFVYVLGIVVFRAPIVNNAIDIIAKIKEKF